MQPNRRQTKRITLQRPARLKLANQTTPIELTDLSEEGCAFIGSICPVDQTEGEIEVTLPVEDERFSLQLPFQVVHCFKTQNQFLTGVKFKPLSTTYRYALHRIIEHYDNET